MTDLDLRARKRQKAREKIVEAAYALFAERGFDAVTVTDIAERAEVGRTTFFRYFGDKQEVVFADEQQHADLLAAVGAADGDGEPIAGLAAAVRHVRAIVVAVAGAAVADADRYRAHERLVARNAELHDRMHRKLDRLTGDLSRILTARGADAEIATLAAQLGVACFIAARRTGGEDAALLLAALDRAFDRLETLGG